MLAVRVLLVCALCMSGCGIQKIPDVVSRNIGTGEVLGIVGLDGRWAGSVTPTVPGCGAETIGLMTIGGDSFGFDPFQSTSVIKGTVQDGNHLLGILNRPGGNKQALAIALDARAAPAADGRKEIAGSLISGRCIWRVTLRRS